MIGVCLEPKDTEQADLEGLSKPEIDDLALALKHAPALVAWPEGSGDDPRPYSEDPDVGFDYHPRPAELFLDWAYAGHSSLFRRLASWRRHGVESARAWVASGLEDPDKAAGEFVLGRLVFPVWVPPRHAQTVWERYKGLAASEEGRRHPTTVYARVVRGQKMTTIQYWLFYVFNDYWNRHEADWELITVHLRRVEPADAHADERDQSDLRSWEPRVVACSSHLSGSWRPFPLGEHVGPGDVELTDDGRPVVYVARGSHANYLHRAEQGHLAYAYLKAGLLRWQFRLGATHGRRDFTARRPEPPTPPQRYRLRLMPTSARGITPGDPRWDDWFWLRHRGTWGPSVAGGVRGPAQKPQKWHTPVAWAQTLPRDGGAWDAHMDFEIPPLSGTWALDSEARDWDSVPTVMQEGPITAPLLSEIEIGGEGIELADSIGFSGGASSDAVFDESRGLLVAQVPFDASSGPISLEIKGTTYHDLAELAVDGDRDDGTNA